MRPLSLYMEGFKTFAEPVTFDFTEYPDDGLCFVTGDNKVDPELGANGTGKSSAFDGLCHACFGKTSRGLKASDIASWQVTTELQAKAEATVAAGGKKPSQKALTPSVTTRLTFENTSGDICVLNRRWNPNVLTLQVGDKAPQNVDQTELDAFIGYNFDEFLQAAYFSQFQDLFLDMGSTERSALVAKVLNLNVWDTYADKAKRDADAEKEDVEERRRNIERVKGQIEELEASDLTEQIEQWDQAQKDELADMEADLAELVKGEAGLREDVTANKATYKAHRERVAAERAALDAAVAEGLVDLDAQHAAELEAVDKRIVEQEDAREAAKEAAEGVDPQGAIRELTKTETTLQSELRGLERAMDDVERRAAKVEKLEGDCSSCGQPITEEHVDHELETCDKELERLETEAEAIEAKLRKTGKQLRKLEKEEQAAADKQREIDQSFKQALKDLRAERAELASRHARTRRQREQELRADGQAQLNEADAETDRLAEALQAAKDALARWEADHRALTDDIAACKAEENPHQLAQERNEKRLAKLNAEREEQFVELEAAVEAEQASRYWVKGFKNVKLFAVSAALNELEAEVNNALDGLGLGGWEVEFDVDKATKSGTFSKGFFAFISGPDNPEPVKWEAWSGGESQRLRLAASLGLANMIRASKGLDLPFEIWDEPSQWMSDAGINGLLDVLQRRARRLKRQIWLIDHRGLEYPFDAAICVEKTHTGSTIHNVTHELAGGH